MRGRPRSVKRAAPRACFSGGNDDGKPGFPATDAPTSCALVSAADIALPAGSTGYLLDGRRTADADSTKKSS
jgi:hypothetical protein